MKRVNEEICDYQSKRPNRILKRKISLYLINCELVGVCKRVGNRQGTGARSASFSWSPELMASAERSYLDNLRSFRNEAVIWRSRFLVFFFCCRYWRLSTGHAPLVRHSAACNGDPQHSRRWPAILASYIV